MKENGSNQPFHFVPLSSRLFTSRFISFMKIKYIFILVISTLLTLWCNTAQAKKRRPAINTMAPAFSTDWTNADSLRFYYHSKLASGDSATAYRIADSLIFQHFNQFDSVYTYLQPKTTWQVRHFQQALAIASIDSIASKFGKNSSDASASVQMHLKIASLYARTKMFEKAHEQQQLAMPHLLNALSNYASQTAEVEVLKNENETLQKALKDEQAVHTKNFIMYAIAGLVFLCILLFLIFRLIKVRNRQKNLDEQIAHTRNQVEKSMEEEESTKREIKYLKEQMSRVEFENNQLKKNIKESTTETLPLLRSQLDGIVKESQDAIPVEKYMQLQNIITRFNKQMREATGDSQ